MKKLILSLAVVLISTSARAECEEGHIIGAVTGECVAAKGSCGTNCSYTLDENGKLEAFPTEAGQDAVFITVTEKENIIQANLGEGITGVGFRALWGAHAMTEVNLPQSLTSLDEQAFAKSQVTRLVIPENIKTLAGYTTYEMNHLNTVILPEALTSFDVRSSTWYASHIYCATEDQIKLFEGSLYMSRLYLYQKDGQSVTVSKNGREIMKYASLDDIDTDNWIEKYQYSDDKKYGGLRQEAYGKDDENKYLWAKIYRPDGSIVLVDENNKFINKLHAKIYTVEEAMKATENGDKFHVYLTYK